MDNLPDFSKLTQLLLKDCRTIQLLPHESMNNSHAMRLIPARNGVPIDSKYIDVVSLPLLDLDAAGIDWDRHPDNVRAAITAFLTQHTFELWPTFNLPVISAIAPMLNGMLELTALSMAMKYRHSWRLDPSEDELEREMLSPLAGISVGFFIQAENVIAGLDLSNPVRGLVTHIPLFVLPTWGSIDATSPVGKAFAEATRLIRAHMSVTSAQDGYKEYLDHKSRKWYFRFWNWKKWWEKTIATCQQRYAERLQTFEEVLAAA
ncbi:MAG TPA: hypothetical protein VIJ88_03190 [Candidatus Paceibacterota bacterium]